MEKRVRRQELGSGTTRGTPAPLHRHLRREVRAHWRAQLPATGRRAQGLPDARPEPVWEGHAPPGSSQPQVTQSSRFRTGHGPRKAPRGVLPNPELLCGSAMKRLRRVEVQELPSTAWHVSPVGRAEGEASGDFACRCTTAAESSGYRPPSAKSAVPEHPSCPEPELPACRKRHVSQQEESVPSSSDPNSTGTSSSADHEPP